MYPKETDKRRCRPEMKFVGDLMYGQVSCHDKPFGSDKNICAGLYRSFFHIVWHFQNSISFSNQEIQ